MERKGKSSIVLWKDRGEIQTGEWNEEGHWETRVEEEIWTWTTNARDFLKKLYGDLLLQKHAKMHTHGITLNYYITQETVPQLYIICCQINHPVPGTATCFWVLAYRPHSPPQNVWAIGDGVGCPTRPHSKPLLLKTPHAYIINMEKWSWYSTRSLTPPD